MNPSDGISTLELIRASWPIVAALVGTILWLASTHFLTRQNREDFKEFRNREYMADKENLLGAIRDVQESQERSELKLEAKLEKMSDQSQALLSRIHEEQSKMNVSLARVEGKLSNMQVPKSEKNATGRA